MDIVVLSHLRWDFVYQRPQHLVSRAAMDHRVLFVEEHIEGDSFGLAPSEVAPNLTVLVPCVPAGTDIAEAESWLAEALRTVVAAWRAGPYILWHYSVMAEPLTRGLEPALTVYDCMDELPGFLAPPEVVERERRLIARADLVFTSGYSLYEAKKRLHAQVHPFPSSVDVAHFRRAHRDQPEPGVLEGIGRPRLVYAGVIDERLDLRLVEQLAAADIGEVVLVGPVVKIDDASVPSGPRIHRLGMQPYRDLPAIFAHADVGLMPFALNEATRYISPTKTPEYLAAGLPVVSTPIADVVLGYGDLDLVHIAGDHDAFVAACRQAIGQRGPSVLVDARLAGMSWNATWAGMEELIQEALVGKDTAEPVHA